MYDLFQHTYIDAILQGRRKVNEQKSLCSMVDRSRLENVLLMCDRGYEGYNLLAHIQEKGWKFLIRVKDASSRCGIVSGLDLPASDEFDFPANCTFDYLPQTNRKYDPKGG